MTGQVTCPACGVEMSERTNPTPDQAWCGMWMDHPPVALGGCTKHPTILLPSDALLTQERELHEEHHARIDAGPCPMCERAAAVSTGL